MTTAEVLPQPQTTGQFLTTLYDLNITVSDLDSFDPKSTYVFATYADDQGEVKASIACDIDCAAKLAAALTQIPAGGVEDSIKSGKLPDNLSENLSEIFNILVNVFPDHTTSRLAIADVQYGQDAITSSEDQGTFSNRCQFEVDIQRYGAGKMQVAAK
jgi:hypothetical protein